MEPARGQIKVALCDTSVNLTQQHAERKDDQYPDKCIPENEAVSQFAIRHVTTFEPTRCDTVRYRLPIDWRSIGHLRRRYHWSSVTF
jgi:hypothetical protein